MSHKCKIAWCNHQIEDDEYLCIRCDDLMNEARLEQSYANKEQDEDCCLDDEGDCNE